MRRALALVAAGAVVWLATLAIQNIMQAMVTNIAPSAALQFDSVQSARTVR